MYLDIPEEMLAMIEPIVADHGLELVDIERHQGRPPWTVRVIVDTREGDGRVPVDRCAALSREIGAHLDARDSIPVAYRLEVSSPGLDRKLTKPAHFHRFLGSTVRVKLRFPLDGRRNFRGTLSTADHERIEVEVDGVTYRLEIAAIDSARLIPSY